jgi:hypothetical protein
VVAAMPAVAEKQKAADPNHASSEPRPKKRKMKPRTHLSAPFRFGSARFANSTKLAPYGARPGVLALDERFTNGKIQFCKLSEFFFNFTHVPWLF